MNNQKPLNNKKLKSAYQGMNAEGQHNLTARESQISNGTLPYNVSYGQRDNISMGQRDSHNMVQRESHKTNQSNATQKYPMIGRLAGTTSGQGVTGGVGGGNNAQIAHSSHVLSFDNELI